MPNTIITINLILSAYRKLGRYKNNIHFLKNYLKSVFSDARIKKDFDNGDFNIIFQELLVLDVEKDFSLLDLILIFEDAGLNWSSGLASEILKRVETAIYQFHCYALYNIRYYSTFIYNLTDCYVTDQLELNPVQLDQLYKPKWVKWDDLD